MPGPYAHMTLVNLLRQAGVGESLGWPVSGNGSAIPDFFRFCELGSISPDYPNLGAGEGGAEWGDAMHYRRTGAMIRSGVEQVREIRGEAQIKLLAWLLGYCAHVVTDLTIHPVVLAKVGDYAANRRRHRLCEMHQDVHVFRRMNRGQLTGSGQFSASILNCGNPEDIRQLDRDLVGLWESMFQTAHPRLYAASPPDIQSWHSRFVDLAGSSGADGSRLFPLASLIATGLGVDYPAPDDVDRQYVEGLRVPSGPAMQYDAIFDRAAAHVVAFWKGVVGAVGGDDGAFLSLIGEWDLDTGRDENNRLVCWGDAGMSFHPKNGR